MSTDIGNDLGGIHLHTKLDHNDPLAFKQIEVLLLRIRWSMKIMYDVKYSFNSCKHAHNSQDTPLEWLEAIIYQQRWDLQHPLSEP